MGWLEDLYKGASDIVQSDVVKNYVAPAVTNYAANYAIKEIDRQSADKTYQETKDRLEQDLSKFDQDYDAELKGIITPQQQAIRDASIARAKLDLDKNAEQAKMEIIQRYTSAGIGGQRLADELATVETKKMDALGKYASDIDLANQQRVLDVQLKAKQARTGVLDQMNQRLEPLASAAAPIDTNALALRSLVPGVVQGAVSGGAAAFQGKDIGAAAGQGFKQAEYTAALKSVGLDPAMFNPKKAERPFEVGGRVQEPIYEANPITGEQVVVGYKAGAKTDSGETSYGTITEEDARKILAKGGSISSKTKILQTDTKTDKVAIETQIMDNIVKKTKGSKSLVETKYNIKPKELQENPALQKSIVIAEQYGVSGYKPIWKTKVGGGRSNDDLLNPLKVDNDGVVYSENIDGTFTKYN